MIYRLILLILILPILLHGQTTSIPDPFFEQKLIDAGYDTGVPDGEVLTANISTVTYLNFYNGNINPGDVTDLTGIEDFVSLKELHCSFNDIQIIDLSGNSDLTHLDCSFNFISELNVNDNPKLSSLNCYSNKIEELDLTNNLLLDTLLCGVNDLSEIDLTNNSYLKFLWLTSQNGLQDFTNLDLSNNLQLEFLHCGSLNLTALDLSSHLSLNSLACFSNDLHSLNVKNGINQNFNTFSVGNNPNLNCITVDDPLWSEQNWTSFNGNIDNGMFFSLDCSSVSQNNALKVRLKIYPNPTSGRTIVDLPTTVRGVVYIYDLFGRIIFSQRINGEKIDIDLQSFATGTYQLKVRDWKNVEIASELLVKW